jgi:hypothetical protein
MCAVSQFARIEILPMEAFESSQPPLRALLYSPVADRWLLCAVDVLQLIHDPPPYPVKRRTATRKAYAAGVGVKAPWLTCYSTTGTLSVSGSSESSSTAAASARTGPPHLPSPDLRPTMTAQNHTNRMGGSLAAPGTTGPPLPGRPAGGQ